MQATNLNTQVINARKGLLLFFALLILGTAPLLWYTVSSGLPSDDLLGIVLVIMWIPGIASIITRLVRREGFADVSFQVGGKEGIKALIAVLLFPVLTGVIAYGIAWASGVVQYSVPAGGRFAEIPDPLLRMATRIGLGVFVGSFVGLISSVGEELGWRGYLVPRLIQAKIPQPFVLSGVVWAVWHFPPVFSGQYPGVGPNRLAAAIFFTVTLVGLSILWGNMRMKTGSFWPGALGHGAWNAIIPSGVFTSFTTGGLTAGSMALFWIDELGLIVAVVTLILGILISRMCKLRE
jgi:uncharacterized protein